MTVPAVGALPLSACYIVRDEHQVSTIQLEAMAMGRAHGLAADAVDRLRIVVTEMAVNIARHASPGKIILRPVGDHATGWIEVLALDKGPGIAQMTSVMRDGGSPTSAARRGGGLAGVKWISDLFDVYSQTGHGTAVVAHVGAKPAMDLASGCEGSMIQECVGVVCVPLHGEKDCGDAWAVERVPGRMVAMLVDGLGHGPEAAVAAQRAMSSFRDTAAGAPETMLDSMHTALHRTRGAALSVTVIDQSRRTARFCGVGNVDGRVVTASTNVHLIPQNGIVGHTMPVPQADNVPWPTHGRLVMHSDGISSQWRPDHYPGLLACHPALLAGVLFRDCARPRDDATVIVLRDPLPARTE